MALFRHLDLFVQVAALGNALFPGFLEAGRCGARHFGPIKAKLCGHLESTGPVAQVQSHVSHHQQSLLKAMSLSLSVNCRPEVPHQSQWAAAVEIAEVESLLLRLPPEVSRFIT